MPTKISWTDETWNPVSGCTKVSPGCLNCYASRMAQRLRGRFGYPQDDPFAVTLHPERLEEPLRWKKPRRIFVCSMGDLFHPRVPWVFISDVFQVMAFTPEHTYQVLTKRPGRMAHWATTHVWPPNVWAGVSIESAKYLPRAKFLYDMKCSNRNIKTFVSGEPLLDPLDGLASYLNWKDFDLVPTAARRHFMPCVDLAIVGGETGPGARPMNLDWARSIRDQCQVADVPFHLKALGPTRAAGHLLDGVEHREVP